jgi:hypothetical protein
MPQPRFAVGWNGSGSSPLPPGSLRQANPAPAQLDHQAEIGIAGARALPGLTDRRHDQPAIDLGAIVHARRILLADIAALGEADAAKLAGVAFEPQCLVLAEFPNPFGNSEAQAVRHPAGSRSALCFAQPAIAKRRQTRIGDAPPGLARPMHPAFDSLDRDRTAQPVHGQPAHQRIALGRLAIDQDRIAFRPEQEIEQRLALRREQSRPLRRPGRDKVHVLRDEALQEAAHILTRDAEKGPVGKPGAGISNAGIAHSEQVGGGRGRRKRRGL